MTSFEELDEELDEEGIEEDELEEDELEDNLPKIKIEIILNLDDFYMINNLKLLLNYNVPIEIKKIMFSGIIKDQWENCFYY